MLATDLIVPLEALPDTLLAAAGIHVRRLLPVFERPPNALEVALLGLDGAGKGALEVAEQRGLQQVGGKRPAVDGHESAPGAGRIGVAGRRLERENTQLKRALKACW